MKLYLWDVGCILKIKINRSAMNDFHLVNEVCELLARPGNISKWMFDGE